MRASERKKLHEENIERLTSEYSQYFSTSYNLSFSRRLGVGLGAVAFLFAEFEPSSPSFSASSPSSSASSPPSPSTSTSTFKTNTTPKLNRNVVVEFAFSEYENRNQQADKKLQNELY
ncbi:hypothetical protein F4808DRAFT_464624 [Astrocystis sublimbata]|nr:hypothetical protein F4808DRAFT_464624 [Astrocystis sublimbata]